MFDLLEVLPQPGDDLLLLVVSYLLQEFGEGEVNGVVMVQLVRGNLTAELEPDTVQKVDFLGGQVGAQQTGDSARPPKRVSGRWLPSDSFCGYAACLFKRCQNHMLWARASLLDGYTSHIRQADKALTDARPGGT